MKHTIPSGLLSLLVNAGFFAAFGSVLLLVGAALGHGGSAGSAPFLVFFGLPIGLALAFAPLSAAAKGILDAKGYTPYFQPWSVYAIWAPLVFLGALLAPTLRSVPSNAPQAPAPPPS